MSVALQGGWEWKSAANQDKSREWDVSEKSGISVNLSNSGLPVLLDCPLVNSESVHRSLLSCVREQMSVGKSWFAAAALTGFKVPDRDRERDAFPPFLFHSQ